MPHASFVHLRVHTAYSLAEGAIKVEELVKLCVAQHMPAVAVTDTGNLFGAMEFATAAAKAGVQPIVGCQIAMTREDQQPGTRPLKPDALVVLAQSEAGYRNLMRLVSRAFLETEPGLDAQLPWSALEGATDGLLALTAGPAGIAGRLLLAGQDKAATVAMDRLRRLFPERLYVELARQGVPDQVAIEPGLLDMADRWSLPLVATNEAFFAAEEMYDAHDALLCIAAGSYVSESARPRVTRDHRFKTAAEMTALFADVPEATANTLAIARRCGFMPVKHKPILPAYGTAATRTEEEELKAQAEEGLEERLRAAVLKDVMAPEAREAAATPYRERLAFELTVIQRMGYGGYFLIVADFIKWAKANGIPVGPGRGSGAGSVVAWALTITDLDPLRFGLLFERFLNPERVSMPDFDVDFCQERRDEVIAYVRDKYGADRVAHIITFGKLQARAVLRDVGRVLQMPFGQVDRICKMVPNNPANPVTLQKAIDDEPRLQQLRDEDESVAHLLKLGLKLEGLYRNASTHAAGVVIGDRPLAELVPLYRDPRAAMPATQFNMKWVEEAGLVKFDFLGLKTLTVLVRTVELLKARGVEIDLSHLPLDDAKSFEMLGRAEVTGVFQMESTGMRDVLRRLRPDRFEDLIAVVALYRPGPMGNIPSYIARKHGKEKPDYIYPGLEAVLAETYGIIIYQEQVMQIAQILAGYSLGKADLLRRAMGKKDKKAMEAEKVPFVAACVEQGVPEARAKEIFDLIEVFAGYGFNKSHAAAYALVAYQTAYLKANYPVEFMAASMTFDVGNTDKLNVFKGECDRLGIPLLPPDVNRSRPDFSVEALSGGRSGVRYALAAVRNVGAHAMRDLVAERDAKGPFADIADFAGRIDPRALNRRQLESLVCAGAFDSLTPNRRQLLDGLDGVLRHAAAAASERESQQVNLFGSGAARAIRLQLAAAEDWPSAERLQREYESIGFYLSAHPLDAYAAALQREGVVRSTELQRRAQAGDGALKLAGIPVKLQERTSAKGNRFAFLQLSDQGGVFEVLVFSDMLATARDLAQAGKPLLIAAAARVEEDAVKLTVQRLEPLESVAARRSGGLRIFLRDPAGLPALKARLQQEKRGAGKIRLVLDLRAARRPTASAAAPAEDVPEEIEASLPDGYAVTPALRASLKALPGIVDVHEL